VRSGRLALLDRLWWLLKDCMFVSDRISSPPPDKQTR
jgi:hypothetical protein